MWNDELIKKMRYAVAPLFYSFMLLFTVHSVHGQERLRISGQVLDSISQTALEGVSVVIKGTNEGTQTDESGNYRIEGTVGQTLVFRYVGYDPRDILITGSRHDVMLASVESMLDEVAIVGYNVVRKADLTGAVSSINSRTIEQLPPQDPLQAMQGRLAGVDVTANARPGELGAIRIRGNRSLLATNEPLYVVDGIPLNFGGINAINPHDIESIDVLKDASSTAVYGSRAANGVIMITTKKGKSGVSQINYNVVNTFEQINDLNTMFDAGEYAEYRRNAFRSLSSDPNSGYSTPYPNPAEDLRILGNDPVAWRNIARGYEWINQDNLIAQMRPTTPAEREAWGVDEVPLYHASNIPTTDWTDYVSRTGFITDHSLNASMGTDKMNAYISGGFFDQKGTNKGQDFQRYNAKTGVDLNLNTWLRVGGSINATWSKQNFGYAGTGSRAANGIYAAAQGMLPFASPYDENGEYIYLPGGDINILNPILEHDYVIHERTNLRAIGSFYTEIQFMEGLRYRLNFGPDIQNFRNGRFHDERSILRGGGAPGATNYAQLEQEQRFAWTLDNLLYYDKVFADKHAVQLTLLQSSTSNRVESSGMSAIDLPYNSQLWYNLASTSRGALQGWGSGYTKNTLLSYMVRGSYTFADKYLLSGSVRWDGASVLAPNNKWDYFPAASLGWKMEEEDFIRNISWVNQLKPRISMGTIGNSAISPYTTMGGLTHMPIVFGSDVAIGYIPSDPKAANPGTMPNLDLRWERTTNYNAGVDFAFFNNRISGYVDFYLSRTNDLLMNRSIPTLTGYPSIFFNVGRTQTKGVELTLSTTNVRTDDFSWTTDFNLSNNQEKILELYNGQNDAPELEFFIGAPINVFYDFRKTGIWQLDDAEEMARFNEQGMTYRAGDIRVEDVNGDYRIDQNNDRQIIGNETARWTSGLTNYVSYKNWDLSFLLYARWGFTITGAAVDMQGRYASRQVDYWRPDNPTNAYPRADFGNGGQPIHYSAMNYLDGSFLKMRNISLGYTLPQKQLHAIRMSNLRLYTQVLNPFVWTKNGFIDPDIFSPISSRSLVIGLNASF